MRKTTKIILLTLFLFSLSGISFLIFLAPATASSGPMLLEGPHPIDLTAEDLGEEELAIRKEAAKIGAAEATHASPIGEPAEVGDIFEFQLSDDYMGETYYKEFIVVREGSHCLLLITMDTYLTYDEEAYYEDNPHGTWGFDNHTLTDVQLDGLMWEFDNVIYDTVTNVFGEPLPRGDEGQKIWTLIFNIRDDSYYEDEVTSYVVGYFSASVNAIYNKNIMHVDTYDWENRAGPGSSRVMEGVFAHEFQHLVHFDQDPDEPSWMDEACADLAAFLCGYGHWDSHIAYYIVFHWAVSLTFWGGGLEDYGASYLFALYLYEHYGGADFFRNLVQDPANGIEGVENTLREEGYCISFERLFDHWTIANYLDDTSIYGGKFGYYSLDIPSDDTWGWSIDDALTYYYGEPIFEEPFELTGWWGVPQPYTAHYYRFTNKHRAKVYIDGDDFAGTTAYSGTLEWYSGANAWAWRSFHRTFDIPETGATLNFMTFFEIEDDWDYGYVEVYDQDRAEWFTLEDPSFMMYVYNSTLHAYEYVNMRDFILFEQDNLNTPFEQEPTTYWANGKFHAFTGLSNGWQQVSMDLSFFAGNTIEIHFRLWQDGAFTLQNMYVDDIGIPELGFFDDVDEGLYTWETDEWDITDGMWDNNFQVTLLTVSYGETGIDLFWYRRMWFINPATQSGSMYILKTKDPYFRVAIVSNRADHILTSGYTFGVEKHCKKWWKH